MLRHKARPRAGRRNSFLCVSDKKHQAGPDAFIRHLAPTIRDNMPYVNRKPK
jgi:hypothetical protein